MRETSRSIKPCIQLSGFAKNPQYEEIIIQKIQKLSSSLLNSSELNPKCSHLVSAKPSRSEKFLSACASGIHIVTPKYVEVSARKGNWVDEAEYIWSERMYNADQSLPVCAYGAGQRCFEQIKSLKTKGMFHDWKVILLLESKKKKVFKRILQSGGAKIINLSLPTTKYDANPHATHVFADKILVKDIKFYRNKGVPCISTDYIRNYLLMDPCPPIKEFYIDVYDSSVTFSMANGFQCPPSLKVAQSPISSEEENKNLKDIRQNKTARKRKSDDKSFNEHRGSKTQKTIDMASLDAVSSKKTQSPLSIKYSANNSQDSFNKKAIFQQLSDISMTKTKPSTNTRTQRILDSFFNLKYEKQKVGNNVSVLKSNSPDSFHVMTVQNEAQTEDCEPDIKIVYEGKSKSTVEILESQTKINTQQILISSRDKHDIITLTSPSKCGSPPSLLTPKKAGRSYPELDAQPPSILSPDKSYNRPQKTPVKFKILSSKRSVQQVLSPSHDLSNTLVLKTPTKCNTVVPSPKRRDRTNFIFKNSQNQSSAQENISDSSQELICLSPKDFNFDEEDEQDDAPIHLPDLPPVKPLSTYQSCDEILGQEGIDLTSEPPSNEPELTSNKHKKDLTVKSRTFKKQKKAYEMPESIMTIFDDILHEKYIFRALEFVSSISSSTQYPSASCLNIIMLKMLMGSKDDVIISKSCSVLDKVLYWHPPKSQTMRNYYFLALCDSADDNESAFINVDYLISQCLLPKVENENKESTKSSLLLLKFVTKIIKRDFTTLSTQKNGFSRILPIIAKIFWCNNSTYYINNQCRTFLTYFAQSITTILSDEQNSQYFKQVTLQLSQILSVLAEYCRMSSSDITPLKECGSKGDAFAQELASIIKCHLDDNGQQYKLSAFFIKPQWLALKVFDFLSDDRTNIPFEKDADLCLNKIVNNYTYMTIQTAEEVEKENDVIEPNLSPTKKKNINKKNGKGETYLHAACIKNQSDMIQMLLKVPGININSQDNAGWTPLHEACNHGNTDCVRELLKFNSGVGKVALTLKGEGGITPLHDAVMNGNMECVKLLLQYGGSKLLQITDDKGVLPSKIAATPKMQELLTSFEKSNGNVDMELGIESNMETCMNAAGRSKELTEGSSLLKCSPSQCYSLIVIYTSIFRLYIQTRNFTESDTAIISNFDKHINQYKDHLNLISSKKLSISCEYEMKIFCKYINFLKTFVLKLHV